MRQLLTEGLLLSFLGAALGVAIAARGSRLLVAFISTSRDQVALDLHVDLRMLGFTALVAIVTALLFSLAPAWRATRVDPQLALQAQGRALAGGRFRIGRALVATQIAMTLVLVSVAGLLLSSFRSLSDLDPGFRPRNVLVANTNLRTGDTKARLPSVALQVVERLREQPGVRHASAAFTTPVGGSSWNDAIVVDGLELKTFQESEIYVNLVTDGYFSTMSTPFIAGRDIATTDVLESPRVAVVNRTLAQRFFAGKNPLGQTFRLRMPSGPGSPILIVGVVGDAAYRNLREPIPATAYFPITQDTTLGSSIAFVASGEGSAPSLTAATLEAITSVAPRATVHFVPLERQVRESLTRERVLASLSVFFGTLALVLAMIGLYGMMAYTVARRRGDIGIRIALGAAQSRVLGGVLREVALIVGIGVVVGAAGALASARFVEGFLYGLEPSDPATLLGSALLLTAVAGLAGDLPARRAARLDPMTSLREE
jgi:predicted permease